MDEYYDPQKEYIKHLETWLLTILTVGHMRLQENGLKTTKNENLGTTWEEYRPVKCLSPWVI